MSDKSTKPIPEPIVQLQRQLDQFRNAQPRRARIPEALWQAAIELAGQHGLYAVAHPLRLDYVGLKRRLPPGHPALLHIASCSECFREHLSFCFEFQHVQDQASARSAAAEAKTADAMDWSRLASALESNNGGVIGIEHFLEWITAYFHRYSG